MDQQRPKKTQTPTVCACLTCIHQCQLDDILLGSCNWSGLMKHDRRNEMQLMMIVENVCVDAEKKLAKIEHERCGLFVSIGQFKLGHHFQTSVGIILSMSFYPCFASLNEIDALIARWNDWCCCSIWATKNWTHSVCNFQCRRKFTFRTWFFYSGKSIFFSRITETFAWYQIKAKGSWANIWGMKHNWNFLWNVKDMQRNWNTWSDALHEISSQLNTFNWHAGHSTVNRKLEQDTQREKKSNSKKMVQVQKKGKKCHH